MKILIADDEATGRALLQRWATNWGYEPLVVTDGEQALLALRNDPTIQIALIDWVMPGLSGIELCEQVRREFLDHYVYILLLTGKSETEDAVEGLSAGADDYVRKPWSPRELEARLRTARRLVELQRALTVANERLVYEATHDALTGVWNRRAILDELDRELLRSARSREPVGVLMCDVDHFKSINDTWGHPVGDLVLEELPRRIQIGMRNYDRAGRYGGEEFLVVLSNCPEQSAITVAQRIRTAVEARPFPGSAQDLTVTLSVGAASSERGVQGAAALVRAADAALYRAKREGRNRVSLAASEEYGASKR
jgi:diguanylate cyclase (GGDEF)-like protein